MVKIKIKIFKNLKPESLLSPALLRRRIPHDSNDVVVTLICSVL